MDVMLNANAAPWQASPMEESSSWGTPTFVSPAAANNQQQPLNPFARQFQSTGMGEESYYGSAHDQPLGNPYSDAHHQANSGWDDFTMSTPTGNAANAFGMPSSGSQLFASEPASATTNHFTVSSAFSANQTPTTPATTVSSPLPAPPTSTTPPPQPASKEICKYFQFGGCTREDCPFSHELKIEAPAGVDTSKGFILCSNVANMRMSPPKQQQQQQLPAKESPTMNITAAEYIPQHLQAHYNGSQYRVNGGEMNDVNESESSDAAASRYGTGGPSKRPGYFPPLNTTTENTHPSDVASCWGPNGRSQTNSETPPPEDGFQHPAQRHLAVRPTGQGTFTRPEEAEGWTTYRRHQAMRAPLQSPSNDAEGTPTTPSMRPLPSSNSSLHVESVDLSNLPQVSERRKPQHLNGNANSPSQGEQDAAASSRERSSSAEPEKAAAPTSALMHRMLRNGSVGPIAM